MGPIKFKIQECIKYFFECVSQEEGKWKCKICSKTYTQLQNSGYTNLKNHLRVHDEDFKGSYRSILEKSGGGTLDSFGFINKKTQDMYEWIHWIVNRDLPFSEIENEITRQKVKMQPFSVETLMKYMGRLTTAVESKIRKDLANVQSCGLAMDGWSKNSSHYLAIFAVYLVNGSLKFALLCIAPLLDECTFTADEHIAFIEATLALYGKDISCISYISADNCETNRSICRKTAIPLLGCYSHKLNLAVKKFLENYSTVIDCVHKLMVELRTLKNAAQLRHLGALAPTLDNDTRWSSIYEMLKRYFRLYDALQNIHTPSIVEKEPSRQQHKELEELFTYMEQLNSVVVELQRENLSLLDARALLDGVLELFPQMSHHLRRDADIVTNVSFESGILKVQGGKENLLTVDEVSALRVFRKSDGVQSDATESGENLSFAQRLLKRRKTQCIESSYTMDIHHVLPTSNICERLFSRAKLVLTDQRASTLPVNFEMLLFLKINQDVWDMNTLHSVMNLSE